MAKVKAEARGSTDDDGTKCPICWSEYSLPVKVRCGHVFCYFCIKESFYTNNNQCPICRREIDESSLIRPSLIVGGDAGIKISLKGLDGRVYRWFYAGTRGWWLYDSKINNRVENAFQERLLNPNAPSMITEAIAGIEYDIDIVNMIQIRHDQPWRKRQIKRDLMVLSRSDIKGYAGIPKDQFFVSPEDSSPQSSQSTSDIPQSNNNVLTTVTHVSSTSSSQAEPSPSPLSALPFSSPTKATDPVPAQTLKRKLDAPSSDTQPTRIEKKETRTENSEIRIEKPETTTWKPSIPSDDRPYDDTLGGIVVPKAEIYSDDSNETVNLQPPTLNIKAEIEANNDEPGTAMVSFRPTFLANQPGSSVKQEPEGQGYHSTSESNPVEPKKSRYQ